ncbi:hypothetical protein BG011_008547 [Mortierella polycephala]|uniref:Uncharacterized protein n=1 Tax=Mortierella polycephala TaxID=41804 RepID=A0A9P6Q9H4_9FUNG|nr:hypothetical protein BG011_008547 [Mortierella polycephala]
MDEHHWESDDDIFYDIDSDVEYNDAHEHIDLGQDDHQDQDHREQESNKGSDTLVQKECQENPNKEDISRPPAVLPKGSLESIIFREPLNAHSKPRIKRPIILQGLERTESSTNPNNPFQDTSDSELDEVESELELEQEFSQYRKERMRPNLEQLQDGDVCFFCGTLTPYERRRSTHTPYPTIYQCDDCYQHLSPEALPSSLLEAHKKELKQLEESVRINSNKGPELVDDESLCAGDPSLVAAGMSWSAEEGELFFQGLRRFGKHNVWAVQEHVKTRSLAEVVAMIQTMEMELSRRRHFELETATLSKMPMAEEASELQIKIEEMCATALMDGEMKMASKRHQEAGPTVDPDLVSKASLFNMKVLCDLSSRLYIQNESAGLEREVALAMYDALKEWLTPLIKELIVVHHERHRISLRLYKEKTELPILPEITTSAVLRTLYARQHPLDSGAFFRNLGDRLNYMIFDDRPPAMRNETLGIKPISPMWVPGGFGKKYYLNEQVDRAQAEAPDSDQDQETDDGFSAEEEAENKLEAPLAYIPERKDQECRADNLNSHDWDDLWISQARDARQGSRAAAEPSASLVSTKRRRFRETHPLVSTAMPHNTWNEGVERLSANSYALPVNVTSETPPSLMGLSENARIQSMNKRKRTQEQKVYLEPQDVVDPGVLVEKETSLQVMSLQRQMRDMATRMNRLRPFEIHAPGYGILPQGASFMYDATRPPPKSGFGLGERSRGGIWLMDKNPNELINASGYITVSDTEDEREERRGCKLQMKADEKIERKRQ